MIQELMIFLHLFWSLARASQDAFASRLELSPGLHFFVDVLTDKLFIQPTVKDLSGSQCTTSAQVLFVASRKKGVHRRPWFLLEKQVSPACLMALLGMGNDRLKRILECRLDMRRSFGIDAQ